MKKNRTMRIAAAMLVLALLTTCIISGSFAKYVTTGEATSASARVAKWGVEVEASSSLALADSSYDADGTYADADGNTISATVVASDRTGVMAPGTAKNGVAVIELKGTPEVAVSVQYTATVTLSGWTDSNGALYFPLTVKVGGTAVDLSSCTTEAAVKSAIETAINGTVNYAPNTSLAGLNAGKNIDWAWAYNGVSDVNDTFLGNKETAPSISIKLSATVTQLD